MKIVFGIYNHNLTFMNNYKIFIELTRLSRPIGYMLLFWPCAWGLAYSIDSSDNLDKFIYYLILFFLGSVLMRSAGCIVNDIVDRDLDKKIKRTKQRPLASGKISVRRSLIYVFFLCIFAFLILIQFNKITILLGIGSMTLAFSYPFMKRITYWPQLFLGLTFNWGILMSWTSINNGLSPDIIIFYVGAIFWTLGYDTIYGAQDMIEDEIIGIKSTAIKFKSNIKLFVLFCYFSTMFIFTYLFYYKIGLNIFSILLSIFALSLIYQIKIFDTKKPKKCLSAFKTNNFSGLILFTALLTEVLK